MIKPIKNIVIIIFVMSLCLLAFSQTKKEVKQWSKYQKKVEKAADAQKKVGILKKFIRKYPGHFFIKEAREKIAEKFFKEASSKNSSAAYTEFIKNYPDSILVPNARAKIIDLAWENSNKKNTIEIYSEFLQKFPQSKYSVEAQKKISAFKDFEMARSEYTVSAFEKFIKEHSESELVEKAKKKIKAIILKNVKIIRIIYNTSSELDELFYNPKEDIAKKFINEGFQVVSGNSQAYDVIMKIDYKEQKKHKIMVTATRSDVGVVDEYGRCWVEINCSMKFDHSGLGEIFSTEINVKTERSQFQVRRKVGEQFTLSDKVKWDKYFTRAVSLFKMALNKTQFKDLMKGD